MKKLITLLSLACFSCSILKNKSEGSSNSKVDSDIHVIVVASHDDNSISIGKSVEITSDNSSENSDSEIQEVSVQTDNNGRKYRINTEETSNENNSNNDLQSSAKAASFENALLGTQIIIKQIGGNYVASGPNKCNSSQVKDTKTWYATFSDSPSKSNIVFSTIINNPNGTNKTNLTATKEDEAKDTKSPGCSLNLSYAIFSVNNNNYLYCAVNSEIKPISYTMHQYLSSADLGKTYSQFVAHGNPNSDLLNIQNTEAIPNLENVQLTLANSLNDIHNCGNEDLAEQIQTLNPILTNYPDTTPNNIFANTPQNIYLTGAYFMGVNVTEIKEGGDAAQIINNRIPQGSCNFVDPTPHDTSGGVIRVAIPCASLELSYSKTPTVSSTERSLNISSSLKSPCKKCYTNSDGYSSDLPAPNYCFGKNGNCDSLSSFKTSYKSGPNYSGVNLSITLSQAIGSNKGQPAEHYIFIPAWALPCITNNAAVQEILKSGLYPNDPKYFKYFPTGAINSPVISQLLKKYCSYADIDAIWKKFTVFDKNLNDLTPYIYSTFARANWSIQDKLNSKLHGPTFKIGKTCADGGFVTPSNYDPIKLTKLPDSPWDAAYVVTDNPQNNSKQKINSPQFSTNSVQNVTSISKDDIYETITWNFCNRSSSCLKSGWNPLLYPVQRGYSVYDSNFMQDLANDVSSVFSFFKGKKRTPVAPLPGDKSPTKTWYPTLAAIGGENIFYPSEMQLPNKVALKSAKDLFNAIEDALEANEVGYSSIIKEYNLSTRLNDPSSQDWTTSINSLFDLNLFVFNANSSSVKKNPQPSILGQWLLILEHGIKPELDLCSYEIMELNDLVTIVPKGAL